MSTRGDQPPVSADDGQPKLPNVSSSIRRMRSVTCSNSLSGSHLSGASRERRSGSNWDIPLPPFSRCRSSTRPVVVYRLCLTNRPQIPDSLRRVRFFTLEGNPISGEAAMATQTRRTFETRIDIADDTREELVQLLNARLADTFDLYSQLKQAHWNVKGSDFIQLHGQDHARAGGVRGYVDVPAERGRPLGDHVDVLEHPFGDHG